MSPNADQQQGLIELLRNLLEEYPLGLKEFDLVRLLRERRLAPFAEGDLGDSLFLFKIHFLLFHLLYRLKDQLVQEGVATLDIHCLNIRLIPLRTGGAELSEYDGLREYYLDLSHLNTDRDAVEEMLDSFWKAFRVHSNGAEAYGALGLEVGASSDQVKSKYRELAQKLHPDKGGPVEAFDRITWAKNFLLS
ncbi:MAG: DNA-J related domain-containing protein [bacterium]|nr:DNA-J related domain-containing protein [bacterium]